MQRFGLGAGGGHGGRKKKWPWGAGKLIGSAKEDVQGLTWEREQVSRWSKINSAFFLHHPSSKPCPPDQAGFRSLHADSPLHALSSAEAAGGSPASPPSCPPAAPRSSPPPPSPGLAAAPLPSALLSAPLACGCLLQDHLQHCLFQPVQCSNENCREPVLRKDLKEHLSAYCQFREEKCLYCKKDVVVINLQVKKKKKASLWDWILPEWSQWIRWGTRSTFLNLFLCRKRPKE